MSINSKSKGDKYERKIASLLSSHFKEITGVDKAFVRNRSSGAYLGGKNKVRADGMLDEHKDVGDIIVPSDFRFEIECKHYSTPPSFKQIISDNIPQWDKWIEQAEQDAETSGRDGFLLIVKYNLVPDIVILSTSEFSYLPRIMTYKSLYQVVKLEDLLKLNKDKFFKKGK